MRKARWVVMLIVIVTVTALTIMMTPPIVVSRPADAREFETVLVYQGGWQVGVQYEPGDTMAAVTLRMDGMSRWRDVNVEVTSTEPWAPRWTFRLQGQPSEFLTLRDGWTETSRPMTAALAGELARSYRVTLNEEGVDRVFDFSQAAFAEPAPPDAIVRYRVVTP